MNRHLETCKQRAAQEMPPEGQTTPHLHLQVEGRSLPMYWMHLDVPASTTLEALDQFLRDIWLECCGHLSAFEIDGVRYTVDEGLDEYIWGNRQKHMRVPLKDVLHPGQRYSYEYDFGATTEAHHQGHLRGGGGCGEGRYSGACQEYDAHSLRCVWTPCDVQVFRAS